ncbi:MAG: PD-(D/E)XK nuclease family protein, partial [Bdellovibrionales bacterium]|nr:PD-(D/E)XK nuclease family protein [Bdellovibrionales bacterium]
LGEVDRFRVEIVGVENEKKLDLDLYEAESLYKIVLDLLKRDDIDDICVLYRRLRPSSLLLDLLAKNEIPFSAQVKIQYGEDPIINLFLRTIELKLNQNDSNKLSSTHFLMKTLLEVLGVEASVEQIQEKFLGDLATLGLRLAFHKMVYSFGISNSQYQENAKLIDSICRICSEDLIRVFHLLSSESQEQYSLELMNGGSGKRVTIMSAHASKGLEFDAVLLGGIHNNGVQMGKTEIIGKLPKSFRWKKIYNQKKFYKSPMYYIEAEIDKAKEFSESKRLLYVACTRAIKYLGWIDLWANIEGVEKILSSGSNHWIKAMRLALSSDAISEKSMQLKLKDQERGADIALVLKDSLGLLALEDKGKLGVFAETSVTKLSQLSQCPFKFYLSNICKIAPPLLATKKIWSTEDEEEMVEVEEVFYSSMERGTRVHAKISKLLLNEISIDEVEIEEKEKIEWVLNEANLLSQNKNVLSEKQIKFSLFGQMISGIPDLVFENAESLCVWDFKTGMRDAANEDSYWFQLMCYGYAYANLKHFTPEKMIPLTLVYIDQKETVTKTLSLRDISNFLFEKWVKTESLNQVNLNHCRHCDYSSICIHYKSSAH